MAPVGNDDDGLEYLSNKKMLDILLQEIADVRYELKNDIRNLDLKLSKRMDGLDGKIDVLSSEIATLKIEVHQNQTTFIHNHQELEKRVSVLEAA